MKTEEIESTGSVVFGYEKATCHVCGDEYEMYRDGGLKISAYNSKTAIEMTIKDNTCFVCALEEVARKCPEAFKEIKRK